jgi:hypothetical protein
VGAGRFERWRYDGSFNRPIRPGQNSWGAGGRIGYFFSPKWNIELDGSYNVTDINEPGGPQSVGLYYLPFHLGVNYNAPISNSFSWIIGPRLNYNSYSVSDGASASQVEQFEGSDFGFGGITGFRLKLSDSWSIRLDGTLDYIPSPQNDSEGSNTMLGVQGGLSVFLGGKCQGKLDSIRVEPKSQNIFVGDRATLRVTGYDCDGTTRDVSGASAAKLLAGAAGLSGLTFTGTTAGCYDIEVSNSAARKKSTDQARICVQDRAPVAAVALARCELQPATSNCRAGPSPTVTGFYSDGTSRELETATLNADGGTVSGKAYTVPLAPGTYTVVAQCGDGRSAEPVTVRRSCSGLRCSGDKTNARSRARFAAHPVGPAQAVSSLERDDHGHTDGSAACGNEQLGARVQAVLDARRLYRPCPDECLDPHQLWRVPAHRQQQDPGWPRAQPARGDLLRRDRQAIQWHRRLREQPECPVTQ